MIPIASALLFALSSLQGSNQDMILGVPTAVVLSEPGELGWVRPMIVSARRIRSAYRFEKFENDLLCSKVGEDTFIFVKKDYVPYRRLQFRRHVIDLVVKYGYGRPFEFQELNRPEFKSFVNDALKERGDVIPGPRTLIVFGILLKTSAMAGTTPISMTMGPGIPLEPDVVHQLSDAPAEKLTSRFDVENRLKSLVNPPTRSQYQLFQPVSLPQEVSLVKTALEQFQIYHDHENSILDSKVEALLTDPIWEGIKKRRSAKTMAELLNRSPIDYQAFFRLRKDDLEQYGKVPSEEEKQQMERSSLTHQFAVNIQGAVKDKVFVMSLPI